MWKKDDDKWREGLWEHMLDMLPVEVYINLPVEAFSMRGRGDVSIYADDMSSAQYEQMLSEWARVLGDSGRLFRELGIDALVRSFSGGALEMHFKFQTKIGALTVSVHFQGDPLQEPFTIRLRTNER